MRIPIPPGLVTRNRRGVALMLVLWVIVVLSAIAAGVAAAARGQTRLAATVRARSVARYAAESGMVAAMAQLRDLLRSADSDEAKARVVTRLAEALATAGPQALDNARYQVVVEDLGARIDLNNSDEVVVLGLLQQFMEEDEAAALSDALQDWIDEDDEKLPQGAEAGDYERDGSPFRPANVNLLRLGDLTRIRGFTDSVAGMIAPFVTVWGDGRVNVNAAPLPVLMALPELDRDAAEALVATREQGTVLATKAAAWAVLVEHSRAQVSAQLRNITTVPARILIVSRGWEVGHPLTHEIQAVVELPVVSLSFMGNPRITIRHWTERDL